MTNKEKTAYLNESLKFHNPPFDDLKKADFFSKLPSGFTNTVALTVLLSK